MHKIAIISDTHGLLRPEVLNVLQGCEAVLHGGDINKQKILDELNRFTPVYAVRGNNDREWAKKLPETLSPTLYGIRFFMVHNKKMIPEDITGIDIIIYGHSHKYEEKYADGRLWLNPGSCGPQRFTQPVTMAVLEIAEPQERPVSEDSFYVIGKNANTVKVEKIEIPPQAFGSGKAKNSSNDKVPNNIRRIIESVIKETNRGRSVKEIADKNNISEELAEQICRLYLTHPGVDADGIMTKMGL